ncbi:MAG: hypothetical protein BWY63_03841 [Chloroflexi bacterium ADurb.Bin360]|nr:MAG: hypothetical protein BWY63_03841 [Chloroflexi bacterium ADurb.Bin360]
MKWLYCLIMIVAILHPSNVQASAQPAQIVYLGSEVDGPDLYNNYLVSCEIEGDIRINVEFLGGGVYSTIVRCATKITTTGTIRIATLITAAGEGIGPLTPVAIGEPPTPINKTFLPLVAR